MSTAVATVDVAPEVLEAVDLVEQSVALAREQAEAILVTNPQQAVAAAEILKENKAKKKEAEEKRTALTGPMNATLKEYNRLFKQAVAPIEVADDIVRKKLAAYQAEQDKIRAAAAAKAEEERQAAERKAAEERAAAEEVAAKAKAAAEAEQNEKAREAAEKAQAEAEVKLRESKAAEVATRVAKPEPVPAPQKLEGVSTRKIWKHEIVSQFDVPREYTMINEQAIRSAISDGVREIPGVRIYEETVTVVR